MTSKALDFSVELYKEFKAIDGIAERSAKISRLAELNTKMVFSELTNEEDREREELAAWYESLTCWIG